MARRIATNSSLTTATSSQKTEKCKKKSCPSALVAVGHGRYKGRVGRGGVEGDVDARIYDATNILIHAQTRIYQCKILPIYVDTRIYEFANLPIYPKSPILRCRAYGRRRRREQPWLPRQWLRQSACRARRKRRQPRRRLEQTYGRTGRQGFRDDH